MLFLLFDKKTTNRSLFRFVSLLSIATILTLRAFTQKVYFQLDDAAVGSISSTTPAATAISDAAAAAGAEHHHLGEHLDHQRRDRHDDHQRHDDPHHHRQQQYHHHQHQLQLPQQQQRRQEEEEDWATRWRSTMEKQRRTTTTFAGGTTGYRSKLLPVGRATTIMKQQRARQRQGRRQVIRGQFAAGAAGATIMTTTAGGGHPYNRQAGGGHPYNRQRQAKWWTAKHKALRTSAGCSAPLSHCWRNDQRQRRKRKTRNLSWLRHFGGNSNLDDDGFPQCHTLKPKHYRKIFAKFDRSSAAAEEEKEEEAEDNNEDGGGGADNNNNNNNDNNNEQPGGFMILGMHRSGTSMLAGLLANGYGYETGGPLVGKNVDNEKGFFERVDVVLQNDEFMRAQGICWSYGNVSKYDPDRALEQKKRRGDGEVKFVPGAAALAFMNSAKNTPWMAKDPRMCVTLKTWLALMDRQPAIVFTYRHPLEVANSLKKRERASRLSIEDGLKLWIEYNARAIQNSVSLCRVMTSNAAVLENPTREVRRVVNELTEKCRVPPPPRNLTQRDAEMFVDPDLHHNRINIQQRQRHITEQATAAVVVAAEEEEGGDSNVLAPHDKGNKHQGQQPADDCAAAVMKEDYYYKSDYYREGTEGYERERQLYLKSMKLFCDMESGAAYGPDYFNDDWPELG